MAGQARRNRWLLLVNLIVYLDKVFVRVIEVNREQLHARACRRDWTLNDLNPVRPEVLHDVFDRGSCQEAKVS